MRNVLSRLGIEDPSVKGSQNGDENAETDRRPDWANHGTTVFPFKIEQAQRGPKIPPF